MFSYVQNDVKNVQNDVKNCLKTGKIRVFCEIQVYTKQGALLVSDQMLCLIYVLYTWFKK